MSDITTTRSLLSRFDCQTSVNVDFALLRAALLQVAAASDYQMLGICADSIEAARQALATYAIALGYQSACVPELSGAVYVKFNGRSSGCYAEPYGGTTRGVLVSCQSATADGVNEMFGALPLDLFEL